MALPKTSVDWRRILRNLDPVFVAILAGLAGDNLPTLKRAINKSLAFDLEDLESHGLVQLNCGKTRRDRRVTMLNLGMIDPINHAAKACANVALQYSNNLAIELDQQFDSS